MRSLPNRSPFSGKVFHPDRRSLLWVGPSRKQLKEISKASENASQIAVPLAFGKHYWKLVASSQGKVVAESPIYRTEILARYAPTVVFPLADAEIPAMTTPFDLTFKWQKGDDTRQITLEVWKDAGLKQKLTTKTFTGEESFTLPALIAGTYYWRMSSYYTDATKPVMGKVQKFSVKPQEQVRVEPPPVVPVQVNFTMPETQLTQYYLEEPKLGLTWKADKTEQVRSWRVKYL